uniref:Uncharacterized protein n=1 Tax=Rhizophora mucronata TaxID=61149 RepID=A0A2P2NM23_RHIMU
METWIFVVSYKLVCASSMPVTVVPIGNNPKRGS